MQGDKKNKKYEPSENKQEKMVRIRIKPNRAIAGIGQAGDVVEVSALVAKNFVGQGLAEIIEEET